MAKKIKYNGYNVPERASSGGSIPGITGSESVERNYFLHQLYEWQSGQGYRYTFDRIENMFSDFPGPNGKIKANVTTRSGSFGSLTFPLSNSYVKCINYNPPKAVLRRLYDAGQGILPTDQDYMRYIIVGGGGGGGKGTSPVVGTGIGGAGGGGGGMGYGEAKIGGYSYIVGSGGSGATADGNRGATGGYSSIYVLSGKITVYGGQGGGNETLTGSGGSTSNTLNFISGVEITGSDGGRNRASGSNRTVPSFNTIQILGLGDLIDGGSGFQWSNLLKGQGYFTNSTVSGGAGRNINGGPGGGGASLGRGGTENSSAGWDAPGIGGGGGGSGGKRGNGQKGGDGVIYIFW